MIKLYRLPLDCYTKRAKLLSDLSYCNQFMDHLVNILEVQEIGRISHLVGGPSWNGKAPGVSIASVYIESGAQLHTWPEKSQFYLDITSCKDFSEKDVIFAVSSYFDAEVKVNKGD